MSAPILLLAVVGIGANAGIFPLRDAACLAGPAPLHCAENRETARPALERFIDILRQEMLRLSREPARFRLILEFWVRGARAPGLRLAHSGRNGHDHWG